MKDYETFRIYSRYFHLLRMSFSFTLYEFKLRSEPNESGLASFPLPRATCPLASRAGYQLVVFSGICFNMSRLELLSSRLELLNLLPLPVSKYIFSTVSGKWGNVNVNIHTERKQFIPDCEDSCEFPKSHSWSWSVSLQCIFPARTRNRSKTEARSSLCTPKHDSSWAWPLHTVAPQTAPHILPSQQLPTQTASTLTSEEFYYKGCGWECCSLDMVGLGVQ